jgi:hypothetical protein
VTVRSFEEIVTQISSPLSLVKMDVEGAEYEIFDHTPSKVWEQIHAISIEIHPDPNGKLRLDEMVNRIIALGYTAAKEASGANSFFFHRGAFPAAIFRG